MSADPLGTRREAYTALGSASCCREQVYEVLERGPHSNAAIAKALGWPINRVTGRVRELVQNGLVRAAYKDIDVSTGKRVTVWELVR